MSNFDRIIFIKQYNVFTIEYVLGLLNFLSNRIIFNIYIHQITICYGLMSTEMIYAPIATGRRVTLPFYSGCRYVAFEARNSHEVGIIDI